MLKTIYRGKMKKIMYVQRLFIIVFSPKGISRQKADKYEDDEC